MLDFLIEYAIFYSCDCVARTDIVSLYLLVYFELLLHYVPITNSENAETGAVKLEDVLRDENGLRLTPCPVSFLNICNITQQVV